MLRKLAAGLAQLVLVALGVSVVTFMMVNVLPGNAALAILGERATPEAVAQLNQQLGLDRPLLVRYLDWLANALSGNLGASMVTNQATTSMLAQALPVTAEILVEAVALALAAAVPLAVIAAHHPGGAVDRLAGLVAFVSVSIPNFLAGLLLILVFAVALKVLPATGFTPLSEGLLPNLRTTLLPSLTLAIGPFAFYTRLLRGDMIEQLTREDYVVFAAAKGLTRRRILFRHVLTNSLFPLLAMVGLTVSLLAGGSVVVENIFGIPGVGQLLIRSITSRDVPVVQAVVVVIALVVVLVNLLIDASYGLLDPRIRYEHSSS